MAYCELVEIKRRDPRYLDKGGLFILDDDVRANLCSDDSIFIKPEEIERIFNLPTKEMVEEIRKRKYAAYGILAHNVFLRCKNGEITDLEKMKALVNDFGYYLENFLES
ncbi:MULTISPECIES: hypothetical protein [Bacillus]|nr:MULTISPECIES: hypothetical protein [Bacillus]